MVIAIRPVVFVLFGALAIFGAYHRLRAASGEPLDRRAEGWGILIGLRLMALLLFVSIAAWAINPATLSATDMPIPAAWRWLGVIAVGMAVAWLMAMFRTLGKNLTDTVVTRREAEFVRRGPYRLVRNPMYVGMLALVLGTALAIGNWLPAVLGWVIFTLLAIRTRIEERYLLSRFPAEYGRYMEEVGRFWPKLHWR